MSFEDVLVLVVLKFVHARTLSGVLLQTRACKFELARFDYGKQLLHTWLV